MGSAGLGVLDRGETGGEGVGAGKAKGLGGGLGARAPEGVADNEESDVDLVCVSQDLVGRGLDHLAVGDDDGAAIEGFLLCGAERGQPGLARRR